MNLSKTGLMAFAGILAIGLAGAADAKTVQRTPGWTGIPPSIVIARGDSLANIDKTYPLGMNPPSLRQTLNVRGRKTQEFTH